MRGEENPAYFDVGGVLEIPPRARGRAYLLATLSRSFRNTPACAGKSGGVTFGVSQDWKYPRVRGEEQLIKDGVLTRMEIPPRARGRV